MGGVNKEAFSVRNHLKQQKCGIIIIPGVIEIVNLQPNGMKNDDSG